MGFRMSQDDASVQLFNLATMSGIFPGTRAQIYQRVRLYKRGATGESLWAQLQWVDEPRTCTVYVQGDDNKPIIDRPLLQLNETLPPGEFNQRLQAGLSEAQWQLQACGSCARWQALPSVNSDGLPVGLCSLERRADTLLATPPLLGQQTNLALSCAHWQLADGHEEVWTKATPQQAALPKAAVVSDSKKSAWRRLWIQWTKRLRKPKQQPTLEARLLERSGVGAGTEPCMACQGRIANLGALAVQSAEGDKQTFSVWRCRSCYTLYLSNWVDRWERLESLETEETIYRIAPFEAVDMLTVIDSVVGGDHPGRRHERTIQRDWFTGYVAGRTALSHMIKQGR